MTTFIRLKRKWLTFPVGIIVGVGEGQARQLIKAEAAEKVDVRMSDEIASEEPEPVSTIS